MRNIIEMENNVRLDELDDENAHFITIFGDEDGRLEVITQFINIQARVGTDHLYWMSGRVGLSENFDLVGRVGRVGSGHLVGRLSGFFGVNFAEKNDKNCR